MTAGEPAPLARRLVAACLVLLCALLPALAAGARLDAPPAPGEYARVLQGLPQDGDPAAPRDSEVARLFYGMTLPAVDERPPAGSAAGRALLARARLAQVFGILALALLTYLGVTLARGRARAVLTCLLFVALPAVHREGHVLRPETPAALFGLLSLLLLQGMPGLLRPRPRAARSPAVSIAVLAVAAGTTTGLAITALPAYTVYLLVPGGVMLLATLLLAVRFLRILRRRRYLLLPVRAFSRRLLPWVLPAVASLLLTVGLLGLGLDDGHTLPRPTRTEAGLLPAAAWVRWPMLAIAGAGLLLWIARIGLELGRAGRIGAEVLWFVHGAVLLLHQALADGIDALPAVAPMAFLLAEGLAAIALLLGGLVLGRAGSGPRAPPEPTSR